MTDTRDPSWRFWYEIQDLVDGECAQEEINRVMDQAEGYRFQMRVSGCEYILQDRSEAGLRKLKGWLSCFITTSTQSQTAITNTNTSTAQSVVSIEISLNQTMSLMWSLPEEYATTEQKNEIAQLLNELEEGKKEGGDKVKKTAKAIGDYLFDKCIKAVPAVMPFVEEAISQYL